MEYLEQNKKKLLLVVEDDAGWVLIIKHILKGRNIAAIYAETGEEALKLIGEHEDVDCMFLDVSLGTGISGLDLAAKIKMKQCYKDTPMIAMTAHEKKRMGDYEELGFTGYLQKPYSPDKFGALLDTYHLQNEVPIKVSDYLD